MNVFARVEAACASFVETTFARVFPSDLPPEHVARKLVVTRETAPSDTYLVRVHPNDYARFARDREYLESRWSALLAEAARDAGSELVPHVVLHEDPRIVAGSVTIEAVVDESTNHGAALALCVEGGEMRRRYRLDDGVTIAFAHGHVLRVLVARWIGLGPDGGARFELSPGRLGVLAHEHEIRDVRAWNTDEL